MELYVKKGYSLMRDIDCAILFSFSDLPVEKLCPKMLTRIKMSADTPGLDQFNGKKKQKIRLYGHSSSPVRNLLLCGLGKSADFSLKTLRQAASAAFRHCREDDMAAMLLPVEAVQTLADACGIGADTLLKELVVCAHLSLYRSEAYQTEKDEDEESAKKNDSLTILFPGKDIPGALNDAATAGDAEARGMIFARDLINGPANIITPEYLAGEAQKVAAKNNCKCTVLDQDDMAEQGFGALLAVGQGAVHTPRFVILEYAAPGKENDKPLVLVGKGVTFDSGGVSIKPSANMHEMKGDMAGAAAVLGFFDAIGNLPDKQNLPRVIGILCCAENMPDGKALRPGDIITTLSGKTVEVHNTDAEGRMVLCDGLTYAQKHLDPAAVIDIATLTGACVVALGDYGSGLFTGDAQLRDLILAAADRTGDLFWPLPLWDEYDESLKSNVADFTNTGPRAGGAVNAALFLRRFINKPTRWAHLDIAGPGYVVKKTDLSPPGGTGVGVRIFCDLARNWK